MSTIGLTIPESTPTPTDLSRPAAGAPNVVVILLDDVGFAQLEPYGSGIETPAITSLAQGGLRYRNHHVTAMCSPTRAAMFTGQNHHAVGMGFLPEVPIGFPGYTGRIPDTAAALPRLLRDGGYSTFAVGKWHLTPRWEVSASGPFTRWPLGLGFERYYGFLAGDTNQFAPELVSDNGHVEPPRTPAEGYHLTEDLTDRALRFVGDQQQATPNKPFLLWFATGAQHAPHQAPAEWIERFRGRFDHGWDAWRAEVLARQMEMGIIPANTTPSERPPWVQPWDSLDRGRQALFARMMEVYAGFLAHTDDQIGRLLDGLRARGLLDNTLVLLASDNGASAEGGPHGSFNELRFTHDRLDDVHDTIARMDEIGSPTSYSHYAWGWAWAGNTPFKLWKRYTWLGGVRTPLIAHWPARITDGGAVRDQFCHAVDLLPTVLAATGVDRPEDVDGVRQRALDGASLLDSFDDAAAPSPRDRQYFELLGSRAIYSDGWKATTNHVGAQISIERELLEGSRSFDDDRWSLFRLADDFAEVDDLAEAEPDKLAELTAAWWSEAERNQVLPLDDTFTGRARSRSSRTPGRPVSPRPTARDWGRWPRTCCPRWARGSRSSPKSSSPRPPPRGPSSRSATGTAAGRCAWMRVGSRRSGVCSVSRIGSPAPPRSKPGRTSWRWSTATTRPAAARSGSSSTARRSTKSCCPSTCRSAGRSAAPGCESASTPACRSIPATPRRIASPARSRGWRSRATR